MMSYHYSINGQERAQEIHQEQEKGNKQWPGSGGRGEAGEQHQGHLPGLYTCTQINEYQILFEIHCQGD